MAEIFIYSTARLTDGRDEIEDELLEILKGRGEITGGGSGTNIWNIDIEIFNLSDSLPYINFTTHPLPLPGGECRAKPPRTRLPLLGGARGG